LSHSPKRNENRGKEKRDLNRTKKARSSDQGGERGGTFQGPFAEGDQRRTKCRGKGDTPGQFLRGLNARGERTGVLKGGKTGIKLLKPTHIRPTRSQGEEEKNSRFRMEKTITTYSQGKKSTSQEKKRERTYLHCAKENQLRCPRDSPIRKERLTRWRVRRPWRITATILQEGNLNLEMGGREKKNFNSARINWRERKGSGGRGNRPSLFHKETSKDAPPGRRKQKAKHERRI